MLFSSTLARARWGLANTVSSICNLCLLTYALRKKLKTLEMGPCLAQLPAVIGAMVAVGLLAWGTRILWDGKFGHATLAMKLGEVFVPMAAASVWLYLGLTLWLKVPAARGCFGVGWRPPKMNHIQRRQIDPEF